jgi:hypothetical protein
MSITFFLYSLFYLLLYSFDIKQIPNLRSYLGPEISVWVRITRTTIPHGPTNLILCNPYEIWSSDKQAKVHNGSLYLLTTDQNMIDLCIEYVLPKSNKNDFL